MSSTSHGPTVDDDAGRSPPRSASGCATSTDAVALGADRLRRGVEAGARHARATTRAPPCATACRAVASPMPLEPPVMITCAPPRSVMLPILPRRGRRVASRSAPPPPDHGPRRRAHRRAGRRRTGLEHPGRSARRGRRSREVHGAAERRPGRGDRRHHRPARSCCATPTTPRSPPGPSTRSAARCSATSLAGAGYVVTVDGTTADPVTVARPRRHPAADPVLRAAAPGRLRLPEDARRHAPLGERQAAGTRRPAGPTPPSSSTPATTRRTPTACSPPRRPRSCSGSRPSA